jgi:hypothetical protein
MDPQQPDKLLHREQVIRFAGFMMLLSPFANVFLTIMDINLPNKWTMSFFMDFARSQTLLHWLMQLGNIVVGSMMLKGRRPNWIPVLAMLFVFIAHGVLKYKTATISGKFIPTAALLTNIALFLLVYYQEYWQITHGHIQKLKPSLPKFIPKPSVSETVEPIHLPPVAAQKAATPGFPGTMAEVLPKAVVELKPHLPIAPMPPPPPIPEEPQFDLSFLTGLVIDFEGIGPWGYIDSATENEIRLEVFAAMPEGLDKKKVEIPLADAGILQFRMSNISGNKVVFRLEGVILENANAA